MLKFFLRSPKQTTNRPESAQPPGDLWQEELAHRLASGMERDYPFLQEELHLLTDGDPTLHGSGRIPGVSVPGSEAELS